MYHAAVAAAENTAFNIAGYFGENGDAASPLLTSYTAYSFVDPTEITTHLPALVRGSWVDGKIGEGVFVYNNSEINRLVGLAGVRVTYRGGFITQGGFPVEAYFGNNIGSATVSISEVRGTSQDFTAADAAMRVKTGNLEWRRPTGFTWHHSGPPGETSMELVRSRFHSKIAHTGNAADVRKQLAKLDNIALLKKIAIPFTAIALLDRFANIAEASEKIDAEVPDLMRELQCIQNEVALSPKEKEVAQYRIIQKYVNIYDDSPSTQGVFEVIIRWIFWKRS